MDGMNSRMPAFQAQLAGTSNIVQQAGWVNSAGSGLVGSPGHGGGFLAGAAAGGAGGGGELVNHIHVHLDGREIFSGVQTRAVATQRRTGRNGFTKRTR